jgi:hypothetical protein
MKACPTLMARAERKPFEAAHRPQPGFQPAVVRFDRIVHVLLVSAELAIHGGDLRHR